MRKFKEKYIGDRIFYSTVMAILIPMVIQNVVTNFVSMLDNIMVGRLGTEAMNGVSIANQYVFIFNITIFGAIAGPGIFGAQFFGKGDHEGQKHTLRFRIFMAIVLFIIFAIVLVTFDEPLLSLYIAKGEAPELVAATLDYGKQYLHVAIVSLFPFALGQAYASVVRECGETKIPMIGSICAVVINLVLDYGLIFGKLGMPELGVVGAAWATVVAKFVETGVIAVWAHTHQERNKYIVGLFKGFKIPGGLLWDMIKKGLPLLINEFLWVVGISIVSQCYSVRGLEVVGGRNIASVITNLFGVVYIQIGQSIAIIVGNKLGAGRMEEAKDADNKLRAFSIFVSAIVAIIMVPFAFGFPMLYNTTTEIRHLATYIIIITAIAMPMWSYSNACYFTLRSGGKTGITFLFDFCFSWILQIPVTFVLAYFTSMNFKLMFAIATYLEIAKVIMGYFMVRSEIWVHNLVADEK